MKNQFKESWLNSISGNQETLWHSSPRRGRSGGLLIGVNKLNFDIGEIDEDYHVRMLLLNKNDGFKWNLIVVYGAAKVDGKEPFLVELAQTCQKNIPSSRVVILISSGEMRKKTNLEEAINGVSCDN